MIEKRAVNAIKENLCLLERAYQTDDKLWIETLDERICIQLEANNIPNNHDLVKAYHSLKDKYNKF